MAVFDCIEEHVVVTPQQGDGLKFPHLDSCLAMVFVADSGRMVGGHVVMYTNAQQAKLDARGISEAAYAQFRRTLPFSNSLSLLISMIGKAGSQGLTVIQFASCTDADAFGDFGVQRLEHYVTKLRIPTQRIPVDCRGGGVNVYVNSGNWRVTAEAFNAPNERRLVGLAGDYFEDLEHHP